MKDVTVWVLTKPDDPALSVLEEAGPGVRSVPGASAAKFERASRLSSSELSAHTAKAEIPASLNTRAI